MNGDETLKKQESHEFIHGSVKNVTKPPHRSRSSSPLRYPKVACASEADVFASKPADDNGNHSLKLLSCLLYTSDAADE